MDNNGGTAIDNNANAAANATVDEFIDSIINEKGYQNLDDDVRQAMKQDMTQRLMDQIDHAAIDSLSEDKAVELADKLETNPDMPEEEITKFMEDAGVDLNAIAMTTMLQFRMLYLGGSEK
ncbi:MAG: hypothetical protein Q4E47_02210 [Candidatus Saccharibacteria bacterium]|nr:hypothetical protein [Candidatus Saccharibacteria bacterium]